MVVLGVRNEEELVGAALDVAASGGLVELFYEEDFGGEATSFACYVDEKSVRPLRKLPLLSGRAPTMAEP